MASAQSRYYVFQLFMIFNKGIRTVRTNGQDGVEVEVKKERGSDKIAIKKEAGIIKHLKEEVE